MNSNYGKASTALNNFDFDLGIGNNKPRSLNDQKNNSNSYSYSQSKPTTASSPWQPNKPSWTHQPAPNYTTTITGTRTEIGGPTSMVGDIFGKSWNSTTTSSGSIGIAKKDPSLFGDLVSSALGQNKGNNNVPLKGSTTASTNSSFSTGGMANSLPKTGNNSVDKGTGNSSWGGAQKFGSYVSAQSNINAGFNSNNSSMNKSSNLGGPSVRSLGGGGSTGVGMSSGKDPFGSLVDFSKASAGSSLNSAASKGNSASAEDFNFGDFQKASNLGTSTMSSNAFTSSNNQPNAGLNFSSAPKTGNFSNQNQPPVQSSGAADSFDMFFSSSSASGGAGTAASDSTAHQQFSGGDDWGIGLEFGDDGHDVGGTTELEGLPPPPAGVSASTAKSKGQDNYKQGQYADAIKWLSWAVVILDKAGDVSGTMEVLSCRASCYKEVGEYKKAVADCTKVLDHDDKNVSVLVQRALLYESMEKYKLGAEDLKTVMKLDPGNRVARSTIHRLTKMAEC